MIGLVGNEVETHIVAMEVGLLNSSWVRISEPRQLYSSQHPTIVVLEHTFEWDKHRFRAMQEAMKAVGARVYPERALRDGVVPL